MNRLNLALQIAEMKDEIESLKGENEQVKSLIESGVDSDLNTRLAMVEMYEIMLTSQTSKAEASDSMAKIYASLIKAELRTIDQVPQILARQVGALLEK